MKSWDNTAEQDSDSFTLRFSADSIQTALIAVAVDLAERLANEHDLAVEWERDETISDAAVQVVIGERHVMCPASILVDLALALGIQPPPLIRTALR